ncbi:helix-turn-helix domain-containing protein [Streptomyces sp. NPDC057136]|uniref:helix-turn-helix domain-containing protein n=1 Tax=Streptomyces sp. NPDC057136 TaxID=3346029 RepID=UPI003642E77A
MNTPPAPFTPQSGRQQQLSLLRTDYENGATVDELTHSTGLSHGTVINRLRAANTTMRTAQETRRLRADKGQAAQRRRQAMRLRTRYEQDATIGELAAESGLSPRTVRRLLDEAGTTMRSAQDTRLLRTSTAAHARQQRALALRARYGAGAAVPALAVDEGCSPTTIYRLLHEVGATMRPRHREESGVGRPAARPPPEHA